ncbi:MAG: DUF4440 domain-containing protein [Terricaulis sp.]
MTRKLMALLGLALLLAGPAAAQNLSLRAPPWAQALLAADITPTTGGRAILGAPGIDASVRATIAPPRGGVARVIRYDLRGQDARLSVRRFTGHPNIGWWLWGSDAPRVTTLTPAQREEVASLARSASGVAGAAAGVEEICSAGEQAYVEIVVGGRSTSLTRACLSDADAIGRLVLRLSALAGSRTEEELAGAALSELLDADQAFAAKAASDGVPAAFQAFAAEDALMLTRENVVSGRAGVAQRFAAWPAGARLEWGPQAGRVSARGDMGWTWGDSVFVAADGARTPGRYVSVWTRDLDGNWRFALDAGVE